MANVVEIVVKSKDQTRPGFNQAKQGADGFRGSLKRVGETAAGFLSANLIAGAADRVKTFISGSVTAASDLNETISKTNAVFEGSAAGIHAWAAGAVDSMGLSRNAAETLANGMGLTFTQMGIGAKAAADMSTKWVQLSADLGSFNNADPTEVLESMSAATRGEYDSLQKYVPSISAATVEHEALAMTGKKSATALNAHDKLLAVQKILFEQTTKAQGDFAKTADQNANSQKKAAASMENAQAALGKGLLPVMTLGAQVMERLGKVMAAHPGLIQALAAVVGGVLVAAFLAWAISAGTAAVATLAAAAPVLAIVAVVALLVAGAILLAKNWHAVWEAVKKAVGAAAGYIGAQFARITGAAAAVLGWIRGHWPLLLAILLGPIALAVVLIARNWARIRSGAAAAFNAVVSFMRGVPGRIRAAVGNLGGLLLDAGRSVIRGLIDGILGQLGALGGALGTVGRFIADHKGPRSKDLKLLQPAGRAIMEGLQVGIAARVPALGRQLGSITDSVGTAGTGRPRPPGGAVGTPVVLEIDSGGSRLDDLLVEVLRKAIRAKGGNVQIVLGS